MKIIFITIYYIRIYLVLKTNINLCENYTYEITLLLKLINLKVLL